MIKVEINKALNKEKREKIISFLYSLSKEICFSTIHNYKIDEEKGNEIINEYKKRCIEKHHELKVWYDNKEPFLLKSLKKLKIKTEEEFIDYQNQIFHSDMALTKQMNEVINKLVLETKVIDYKKIFPSIASSFVDYETHMFDTATVSLIPLDILVYKKSEEVLHVLLDIEDFSNPVLFNKDEQIYLFNPVFCNDEEGFALIYSEQGSISIVFDDNQYLDFKKLKIKHKKEYVYDE